LVVNCINVGFFFFSSKICIKLIYLIDSTTARGQSLACLKLKLKIKNYNEVSLNKRKFLNHFALQFILSKPQIKQTSISKNHQIHASVDQKKTKKLFFFNFKKKKKPKTLISHAA